MTYRWREHVGPNEDYESGYRDRAELRPWQENDQLTRLEKMVPGETARRIAAEVEREIADAFAFAEASDPPDPDELLAHVYAR